VLAADGSGQDRGRSDPAAGRAFALPQPLLAFRPSGRSFLCLDEESGLYFSPEKRMKLAKPEHPQLDRITIRLDHEKAELLTLYAQMLEADTDYVIAGALSFLFKRDKEFEAYRASVRTGEIAIPETPTKRSRRTKTVAGGE
jgi:hypothetical protein